MISVYRSSETSLGEKRKPRAARGSGITATSVSPTAQEKETVIILIGGAGCRGSQEIVNIVRSRTVLGC